ncbi:MAG: ABC transporter permease subunit [Micrococcaceae bacterium]|nr:ABC transporter permease subunit [Micrococcaceae bacterium]
MATFFSIFTEFDVAGALWVNIKLTFFAAIGATVLGTILAMMRISPVASFAAIGTSYVNIIRNTPLTIIILFGVLALNGQLGLDLGGGFQQNFFRLAVMGLAIYHAAFVCESIRSGVNTVPQGQAEAARAIGLAFMPAARMIILPQAFRGAIVPLGNVLIALIKNSTVAAVGSVSVEASATMGNALDARGDIVLPIFLAFAAGFVIIVIPVGLLTTWLSKKLAVSQ